MLECCNSNGSLFFTEIQASGSTFGTYFCVTTFGESHGGGVGCVIDGCPPRLPLSEADMQVDLDRRRPGQRRITSSRKETDTCKIASGTADGLTTGSPIKIEVPNTDQRGDVRITSFPLVRFVA
ncbi:Chorismate synthase 1, chloroplastic [Olea europaea subsp. europaea]|uniref:chorismate synthase n=1 Tax=Olea europaea subsp. europaea TaxID=158383 RepID=A0A8S0QWQ1_OLEEU|nr:Chorismate synthase 1, chloroplastic [Olea europaea subsp. europaea]